MLTVNGLAMDIGVPKEIKNHEYRVGLLPASVNELVRLGHRVWVEASAGEGAGFTDQAYAQAGATMVATAQDVFDAGSLIIKVKEPQPDECMRLGPKHTLFTYLHLAPDRVQTEALMASGATAIAYETVTDATGRLPLLAPMSEVAGRMSIQAAAMCLERARGGKGILLGGVPGVERARVVILGGGVVGRHAASMAVGLGADVTVLDRSLPVLRQLDDHFGVAIQTRFSTFDTLNTVLNTADVVIGSVLIPGASAPKLVSAEQVDQLEEGTVLVDVAIDQGGCFETSRPTTHQDPIFKVGGVVHYCVANIPGAVPKTASAALNQATLPFVLALANKGTDQALKDDRHLRDGLAIYRGALVAEAAAEAHQLTLTSLADIGLSV